MSTALSAVAGPLIVLVRHGETEWSRTGRHTSTTDVGLTQLGRDQARRVRAALGDHPFSLVAVSPLRRARETATLAGHSDPTIDPDLAEWDYGPVEGRTTAEIAASVGHPWSAWTAAEPDPAPTEGIDALGRRADAVLARVRPHTDRGEDVLLFSHAHLLRVLAARWLGLPAVRGSGFALSAGSISVLAFEHAAPVIDRWNALP